MKTKSRALTITFGVILGIILWGFIFLEDSWRNYQIYALMGQQGTYFDLRHHDQFNWDELVIIKSYDSFCNHGIEKFKQDMKDCPRTSDDGEQTILFLLNNNVVHQWKPFRGRIDFGSAGLQTRIKKTNAVFDYTVTQKLVKLRQ